ncbi:uncharacterized protein PGTG_03064 [Puccinia graminis f. sp. tritici CRL 75-36-700-3]|uniref:Uncharacterized protein n=1 Tax=Puccinia graminis f. sp. tritici (strain CRL 75-36-700-3 / race SCCL) TaxID=418459 RepID=E3JYI3_PUCGT|nr:uncharacterized protein PGTG_03064 [Puccinia graminis f. sp. tritici CRL 75-36-700-3]EFP77108.1 hypothetical protein PGTG_03064 [Puccinia graminis f. sp. tritici CRL 75-36-700-3]
MARLYFLLLTLLTYRGAIAPAISSLPGQNIDMVNASIETAFHDIKQSHQPGTKTSSKILEAKGYSSRDGSPLAIFLPQFASAEEIPRTPDELKNYYIPLKNYYEDYAGHHPVPPLLKKGPYVTQHRIPPGYVPLFRYVGKYRGYYAPWELLWWLPEDHEFIRDYRQNLRGQILVDELDPELKKEGINLPADGAFDVHVYEP